MNDVDRKLQDLLYDAQEDLKKDKNNIVYCGKKVKLEEPKIEPIKNIIVENDDDIEEEEEEEETDIASGEDFEELETEDIITENEDDIINE